VSNRIWRAANIPEFLGVVTDMTTPWFPEKTWGPWFRGQCEATWGLVPTLYRFDPKGRGIRVLEDEIRQEFEVRAPSLTNERPRNMWEWYSLMQHSGAPTRLLDWTEGALIALYFAVRDKRDTGTDASVWVLDPWELNRAVVGVAEVIAPGADAGVLKEHSDRYKKWLPARYEIDKDLEVEMPAAIYPTHFDRRISSQRSCFTIHGSAKNGFDRLPKQAEARLAKIIIPSSAACEIDRALSVAGIDEITIFPDLDGLGRWLAAVLRDESAP
jgi:hypothetical protein